MATGSRKALAYSVRDVPGTNRGVNATSGFSESLVLFPSNDFRNCFPKNCSERSSGSSSVSPEASFIRPSLRGLCFAKS